MKKFLLPFILFPLFLLQTSCGESCNPGNREIKAVQDTIVPDIHYGFDFNNYDMVENEIGKDWALSHLFASYDVSLFEINQAASLARELNLNYITPGNKYYMLSRVDEDTVNNLQYMIYVKNPVEYYVFDFRDSVRVEAKKKKMKISIKEIGARIKKGGNLSFAIDREIKNSTVSYPLIDRVAEIYSWSVDFFHLHTDDKLKIIYEEKSVEGEVIGIGKVHAVLFNHKTRDFYAFSYLVDSNRSFYTEEGKGMKSMFLSAPLKYTRMSSGFNLKRRIKQYGYKVKPHYGTDYAAPKGTPIWTTADGVISRRGYGRGNGNFVKVKHNQIYSTQYLHMSKIASGIQVGNYVRQGEIIGYVGSTGSSSGNHVCYRFWKNGKQVDSRKQKFNNAKPMDTTYIPRYLNYVDSVKPVLDEIEFPALDSVSTKVDSAASGDSI